MEVILLEQITKLGSPGDLVKVRSGYGRNYLIPQGKAIQANEENKIEYEKRRKALEKAEKDRLDLANDNVAKLDKIKVIIPVPVSEEGSMYGSIGTREISHFISNEGLELEKSAIRLPEGVLKEIGDHSIDIELHPEVIKNINISILPEK